MLPYNVSFPVSSIRFAAGPKKLQAHFDPHSTSDLPLSPAAAREQVVYHSLLKSEPLRDITQKLYEKDLPSTPGLKLATVERSVLRAREYLVQQGWITLEKRSAMDGAKHYPELAKFLTNLGFSQRFISPIVRRKALFELKLKEPTLTFKQLSEKLKEPVPTIKQDYQTVLKQIGIKADANVKLQELDLFPVLYPATKYYFDQLYHPERCPKPTLFSLVLKYRNLGLSLDAIEEKIKEELKARNIFDLNCTRSSIITALNNARAMGINLPNERQIRVTSHDNLLNNPASAFYQKVVTYRRQYYTTNEIIQALQQDMDNGHLEQAIITKKVIQDILIQARKKEPTLPTERTILLKKGLIRPEPSKSHVQNPFHQRVILYARQGFDLETIVHAVQQDMDAGKLPTTSVTRKNVDAIVRKVRERDHTLPIPGSAVSKDESILSPTIPIRPEDTALFLRAFSAIEPNDWKIFERVNFLLPSRTIATMTDELINKMAEDNLVHFRKRCTALTKERAQALIALKVNIYLLKLLLPPGERLTAKALAEKLSISDELAQNAITYFER